VGDAGKDRVFGQANDDLLNVRDLVKGNDRVAGGEGADVCTRDRDDVQTGCP
jgi:hypothetical protein